VKEDTQESQQDSVSPIGPTRNLPEYIQTQETQEQATQDFIYTEEARLIEALPLIVAQEPSGTSEDVIGPIGDITRSSDTLHVKIQENSHKNHLTTRKNHSDVGKIPNEFLMEREGFLTIKQCTNRGKHMHSKYSDASDNALNIPFNMDNEGQEMLIRSPEDQETHQNEMAQPPISYIYVHNSVPLPPALQSLSGIGFPNAAGLIDQAIADPIIGRPDSAKVTILANTGYRTLPFTDDLGLPCEGGVLLNANLTFFTQSNRLS
jgi:hypothetical protein